MTPIEGFRTILIVEDSDDDFDATGRALQEDRIMKKPLRRSEDERDINDGCAMGAKTYVQKPLDWTGLFEAMQRLEGYGFEIAVLPRA